ncbi:MAG: S-methyl-5-thioribose-1-phosphate isomerase [Armatimonadetes bacterium]|nr:S-methyl-5-thioribose-1-phosphate isomerase [Armatimonadota bacterium]
MEWSSDHLRMLDQCLLPQREVWLELRTWEEVRDAIRDMAVRGAPAIGVAAAYGMALAAMSGAPSSFAGDGSCPENEEGIGGAALSGAYNGLAASRPTAVNLVWALDRIMALPSLTFDAILAEAQAIEREDLAMNHKIGELGSALVPVAAQILTICNTGSLATAGHGTALGIIRTAHQQGKVKHVWSCETRPRQQGLRLTAWELLQDGIPFHSIADSVAASLMRAGSVDLVVAGADRIAANGDTANKIGTYMLAVLAQHHGVPFVIAAPTTTIDASIPDGSHIPIEERAGIELTEAEGIAIAPTGTPVYNPGFDVTPGDLISAIVTETGVHRPPYSFR